MRLQQWLLDYYQTSTFNTCEHQPLPLVESVPIRLKVEPNAEPLVHTHPYQYHSINKNMSKQDFTTTYPWASLNQSQSENLSHYATAWLYMQRRMASADAQSTSRRLTFTPHVKPTTLRVHLIKHTLYPMTPKSIPLHVDDRNLTTIITPWGRYRYETAPQSYKASGDGYSKRFDEIVSHIPDKTKCIDGTLLWADDL